MKNYRLLFLLLAVFSFSFAACSDDDDEEGGNGGNAGVKSFVADASEYDRWTYFNFGTGESRTLKVLFKDGGVCGMYTGNAAYSVGEMMSGELEDIKVIINRISQDSVSLSFLNLSLSMNPAQPGTPFDLHAGAKAVKTSGKWMLTAPETVECPVTTDGNTVVYKIKNLKGEVGLTQGAPVEITCGIIPGAMPMEIAVTYKSTVTYSKEYVVDGDETSFDWDIAFHKFDIRTNGGSAVKMDVTSLDKVVAVPQTGYVSDGTGHVIVDMSHMMQNYVGEMFTPMNSVLGSWVTATPTGSMPPFTYKMNDEVIVYKDKAGKCAAIKFKDFSKGDKKVFASFDYIYPFR